MATKKSIVLFSKSPRRQELLRLMGLEFRVITKDVDESYPEHLLPSEVAQYIAEKKAKAFEAELPEEVILTADTIVALGSEVLGKPTDAADARRMLQMLSGKVHQVYTGVAILYQHQISSFTDTTEVCFKTLSDEEIEYYINTCKPYDKAGAYGIQEWIGLTAVQWIHGSYTNVMGLPTEKLYERLKELGDL